MRWQGGRRGGNIEDRRGMGGAGIAGGGIGALVLAAIGYFVFGIDPQTTTQLASQLGGVGSAEQGTQGSPEDQAGAFVDVIGSNVDDVWKTKLQGYQPPTVVLYEQGTSTGCGFGQAEANRYSVALELQADCYAGVWAANAASVSNGAVALEAGDLEEGLRTASAIGDDTLQRRQGGQVVPEGFTHGSSAQRMDWLRRGYQSGDPAACDTFSAL